MELFLTNTGNQCFICFFRYFQDVAKAKQFLPFLQRAGRMEGVVEYVASGSRIRLYIPRETCLITFLLSGELGVVRRILMEQSDEFL